jgi:CubicO group peptidase (beta-lactamase class C family)
MTTIFRFIFAALLIALPLAGCSTSTQKTSPQGDDQTSATPVFLGQGNYTGAYWPTREWRECKPEAVGMNSEKLLKAIEYAGTPAFKTDGLTVIRKGHIVGEAYFGNFKSDSKHVSHSMAKSFTSSLVGIAIDKGQIAGLDEKICKFYDEWDCDDDEDFRSRITIRHAMTLTTGLQWREDWVNFNPATNDTIKMIKTGQYIKYMMAREGKHEPGYDFYYSTGDPMLLSGVLQKATGMTAFEFAKKKLFEPIGIPDVDWKEDEEGYTITFAQLYATVRDYARFGYLYLNKGRWGDNQIVSEAWVEKSTRTDPSVRMWEACGYLWHVNLPYRLRWNRSTVPLDAIPQDGYMAEGILGQSIVIIPSKDLVIVRVANETAGHMDLAKFLTMIIDAIEN